MQAAAIFCCGGVQIRKKIVASLCRLGENIGMIGCDDVFMTLTRGPFPTGKPSDKAVEAHLARCSSCRRLAEALRPPEDLVPETVTPEESRSLPSYWGPGPAIEPRVLSAVLAEFDYEQPERKRTRRKRVAPRVKRSMPWSEIFQFLGAAFIGVSLALMYFVASGKAPFASTPLEVNSAVEQSD